VAILGRLDQLQQSGQLEALLISGACLAESVLVLTDHAQGNLPAYTSHHIGPALVFQQLWEQTGCQHVIGQLLKGRRYEFPLERAVFLTVLHRLFDPGSDRAAEKWKEDYQIEGCESLQLHHLYRAMAWQGEELPRAEQANKTPFAPRCTKYLIEERLFAHRRDLFTELQLVFFDTTSIYFEGEGGETISQRGHSKDHRPDLKQTIVGVVLDGQGRPICCELWPGNTADVNTLIPVVDRLRGRFAVGKVCIVADRGMISQETIEELEKPQRSWQYILGARMRAQSEVRDEVLARAGRYRVIHPKRDRSDAPAPLEVKEVWVEGRRYIICRNQDEARKDAADREAIGIEEPVHHLVERPVAPDHHDRPVPAREGGTHRMGGLVGSGGSVEVEGHPGGVQRGRDRRPVSMRPAPGAGRVHHQERGCGHGGGEARRTISRVCAMSRAIAAINAATDANARSRRNRRTRARRTWRP